MGFEVVGRVAVGLAVVGRVAVGLAVVGRVAVGLAVVGLVAVGLAVVGRVAVGLAVVGRVAVGLAVVGLVAVGLLVVDEVVGCVGGLVGAMVLVVSAAIIRPKNRFQLMLHWVRKEKRNIPNTQPADSGQSQVSNSVFQCKPFEHFRNSRLPRTHRVKTWQSPGTA